MDGKRKRKKGGRNRRYSRRELHSVRDSEDNDEQSSGTIYTSVLNFESCFPFGRSKLIVSKVIIFVSKQKCIIKRKIQRHTYSTAHCRNK